MSVCYLGIGSNLGNRKQNIRRALERIGQLKGTKILKLSKIIETKPVGGPGGQRDYLNACLKLDTALSPIFLLKELKTIEKELGRKKSARFGPRPIDLDILLFENKIINRKELKIPHPRMFERDFVLRPLAEIL
ncbi:MAG: 2-amino-4-hydroxy-6-hydroxymethyldihydropteridine diphosphokinase [Candidatus Omnitrophica bacterium]|nr:2-amino-4-hydroxy-6-hydroxymethyldihydropteridine diphosphokinase [Candidatus Omnitrophota bacterium]MDD5512629.1 2-amino-4-hydroxy-6-hydroxymethyldihydropteridine diphosphokinase [Candidatus Omnitrophota bacterium]